MVNVEEAFTLAVIVPDRVPVPVPETDRVRLVEWDVVVDVSLGVEV